MLTVCERLAIPAQYWSIYVKSDQVWFQDLLGSLDPTGPLSYSVLGMGQQNFWSAFAGEMKHGRLYLASFIVLRVDK